MSNVKTLVMTGYGLNCEGETTCAFELAGASVDCVHLNDLFADPRRLLDYKILAFVGGFSFGDHLGAGTVLANRLRHRLGSELNEFITSGRLVIGICNGFQTMSRLGLVPALDGAYFKQQAALALNDQGVFRNDWITLKCNPESPCVFTKDIDILPLPVRHGEGKFVMADSMALQNLERHGQVAMRYVHPETANVAEELPHNPNGSVNGIAGICDLTGRVFGLMPHPEAYLSPYNHPHWIRQKINGVLPEAGLGRKIFENAVQFAEKEL
jgi:phosphoribosylformylglycinamidine synthase